MLSQRRHGQLHDRKPVIKVLPELLLSHSVIQVAIGGGDHAHINLDRMRPPNPFELPLLENAQ